MAINILRSLHAWFRPLLVALTKPNIPWVVRWRLLVLQPICLITYSISTAPYLLSRPFTVEYLSIAPGRSVRALVFKAAGTGRGRALRPLHVDIHGGGFIGGVAEHGARFSERVAARTGAVVVAITHRFAPEHPFPAAIDDVDATIRWVQEHAVERWGADPELMTVTGASAGANLAVAATQQPNCQGASPVAFKGILTFCGLLDVRLKPEQKAKPAGVPEKDPLAVLLPLFDAYAGPARAQHRNNPRLSPTLAPRETLPPRMLLVVAAVDILFAEQMEFAKRVNGEDERAGDRPRVEVFTEDEGFHGYLEVPDFIVRKELKERAFNKGVDFLRETYKLYGWDWEV